MPPSVTGWPGANLRQELDGIWVKEISPNSEGGCQCLCYHESRGFCQAISGWSRVISIRGAISAETGAAKRWGFIPPWCIIRLWSHPCPPLDLML